MFLTREERERFARWAEENAASNEGIKEQMRKLPGCPAPLMVHYEEQTAALRLVAALLGRIEDGSL